MDFLKKNRNLSIGSALLVGLILWAYYAFPTDTEAVLAATIRHSTPLILGALCGLWGERSGIINIGIEGQMLLAAFTGFLASAYTNNLFLAVLVGVLTGMLTGVLLGYMSITLKVDQIIGGTVINILALGLTGFFYQQGLSTMGKLSPIRLGFLADIPLLGPVLFNNPPITYTAIALVFFVHFMLFHTKWGLRTRAVGEHPRAADTVGVNVFTIRWVNIILAGGLSGLAGAFLSLESVGFFERGMTAGLGFLALAVMIFGKWTPFGAWGAALLFGFTVAAKTQVDFVFGNTLTIPQEFIDMIPYIMTLVVLAGFVGRSRPPAAEGIPYEKEG